jgi:anti-anti-sigma factor
VAGTPTFRVDSTRTGARRIVAATGELDSGTAWALTEAFERAAAEPEDGELHLDLGGLSFIDSAGLRAIIQLERSARERDLPLLVTPPPAPLTELLELTGVAERLALDRHHGEAPRFRSFVERVEVDLAADLSAPARARAEVRQVAADHLEDTTLDSAVLLTSELVANAVIHPPPSGEGGCVGLQITCYEDGIRCEITDQGPGFDPAELHGRRRESGGRGLMLVDALAARWGTERPSDQTFCVWFELKNESAVAAEAAA